MAAPEGRLDAPRMEGVKPSGGSSPVPQGLAAPVVLDDCRPELAPELRQDATIWPTAMGEPEFAGFTGQGVVVDLPDSPGLAAQGLLDLAGYLTSRVHSSRASVMTQPPLLPGAQHALVRSRCGGAGHDLLNRRLAERKSPTGK
jgi:hypothetical protein